MTQWDLYLEYASFQTGFGIGKVKWGCYKAGVFISFDSGRCSTDADLKKINTLNDNKLVVVL